MPPDNSGRGNTNDQRTADALWLFDALMDLPTPIWLDAKAVAEKKGTKPPQAVTRIRQMKVRFPQLSIVCSQGPPGTRGGRTRKSGGGADVVGDGDGDDDRENRKVVPIKRGRKPSVKKVQKVIEINDEEGDEGAESGNEEEGEEVEEVKEKGKMMKNLGRRKSTASEASKSSSGKSKPRDRNDQVAQAKEMVAVRAVENAESSAMTDEDDADVEDNEVEKEGQDEIDELALSQPRNDSVQKSPLVFSTAWTSRKRKRSVTLAPQDSDELQSTLASLRNIAAGTGQAIGLDAVNDEQNIEPIKVRSGTVADKPLATKRRLDEDATKIEAAGEEMDVDVMSESEVKETVFGDSNPSTMRGDKYSSADSMPFKTDGNGEEMEVVEMASRPKQRLPWLHFNPDAVPSTENPEGRNVERLDQNQVAQLEA